VPTFEASDSPRGREGVSVQFWMCWHQGVVFAFVEVAMVIMTFRRGPTGVTRGRSTGKKYFFAGRSSVTSAVKKCQKSVINNNPFIGFYWMLDIDLREA